MKKLTTEEFIERAINKHGNVYDYSNVYYKNSKTKVCIICPEHGEFKITPSNHLKGEGCPICRYLKTSKKLRTEDNELINKLKEVHRR